MASHKDLRETELRDAVAPRPKLNVVDKAIAYFSPGAGLRRFAQRSVLALHTGYEAANPSRKRKFSTNTQSGNALAGLASEPLRVQARHLDRNHDITTGALDKLVDFTIGPNGIQIEPQPKKRDGSIHQEFAERLQRHWNKWSEWPEVTWTHDRAGAERLLALTWFRDGEGFSQLIEGPRGDQAHAGAIPFSLELIEPDLVPMGFDDVARRIRQGVERNSWGRPVAYHVYRDYPGDSPTFDYSGQDTKRIGSELMTHVRTTRRMGQLRGISILAPAINRLIDIHEYEGSEQLAAKMAADLVFQWTRGAPEMFNGGTPGGYDPLKLTPPPVFRMDGGMIVAGGPGEGLTAVDTKRPNTNAAVFIGGLLRHAGAGIGLSYSAIARDYNGTYSAQRQELVESWPHYHALTGMFVAQHERHVWQRFVAWELATYGIPAGLDMETVGDALFLGPPMPWIDPVKEAEGQILLVQACFKSSAQVIRERSGSLNDVYRAIAHEQQKRRDDNIASSLDGPAVSPAKDPDDKQAEPTRSNAKVISFRRQYNEPESA